MKFFTFSRKREIRRALELYRMYLNGTVDSDSEIISHIHIKEFIFHGIFSSLMPQDLNQHATSIVDWIIGRSLSECNEQVMSLQRVAALFKENLALQVLRVQKTRNLSWIRDLICGFHNYDSHSNQEETSTKRILECYILSLLVDCDENQYFRNRVSFFLERFDITGRIYEFYHSRTNQPLGRYNLVENYILLGVVLIITFGRHDDLRALNAALKVYDLLSVLIDQSRVDCYFSLLAAGFILEERMVLDFYEREGFRLPVD